ncbi:hypothetical protein WJX77_009576 [Trebouxia sp. C0004]
MQSDWYLAILGRTFAHFEHLPVLLSATRLLSTAVVQPLLSSISRFSSPYHKKMNKVNVALFFAALMVIGACAEPRKLLATTEGREVVEAEEHQRILAELEEVHQLRERMLQAAATYTPTGHAPAPAPAVMG